MAAVNQVVDETIFRYRTEGVEQTRAQADALAKSQTGLAKTSEATATASTQAERSARGAGEAYGGLSARSDAAAKMAAVLERAQRQMAAAMEQAAANAGVYETSLLQAADAESQLAQASRQASVQTVKAANDNAAAASAYGESAAAVIKLAAEHPIIAAAAAAASAKALSVMSGAASTAFATASQAAQRYANDNREAAAGTAMAADAMAQGLGMAATVTSALSGKLGTLSERLTPGADKAMLLARALASMAAFAGPIAIGLAAVAVGAQALQKAYDDLDKLVQLGERAEKLDLSAPFVKSFQGVGKTLGLEIDQVTAALDRASAAVRDKFGQGNPLAKIFADLDAGGAGLSDRVKLQAELAQTTAQRLLVALDAMRELEAAGNRLALLDLADKMLGPDFAEKLRTGQLTIERFTTQLDEVRSREFLKQEDVSRAVALQREIAGVKREIADAWETTLDFSGAAGVAQGVWVGVLKVARDGLQSFNDIFDGQKRALANIQVVKDRIGEFEIRIPTLRSQGRGEEADAVVVRLERARNQLAALERQFEAAKPKMDVAPELRSSSEELQRLTAEAERAKTVIPGLDGALMGVALAAANVAKKVGTAADAIRAIQGLNPDLSGVLGYFDKVGEAQKRYSEALQAAERDFQKPSTDLTGNELVKRQALTQAMEEYRRTVQAVEAQRRKPLTDLVTEGERTKLTDLGRTVAQIGDRVGDVRKNIQDTARIAVAKLSDPSLKLTPDQIATRAEAIRKDAEAEVALLDTASKALTAKARADDAAKEGAESARKAARDAKQEWEDFLKKAEEAFKKIHPADALRKQGEELARDLVQYRDRLAAIDPRLVTSMETRIKLNLSGKEVEGVKEQTDELAKEMSTAFRGVFDEMFSSANAGFAGLLDGFTKSLSRIGTRLMESTFLTPLFSGKEGASAPSVGGFNVGGLDFDKLKKSLTEGSFDGITEAFGDLLKPGSGGKGTGFASTKLGGGLLSAGVGASVGYQSKSPLIGALGGAASGFAMGGPVGGVVGGVAGLLGGLFGKSEAQKEARKRVEEQLRAYREAFEAAKPEIAKLQATLRGESLGNVGGKIDAAFQQAVTANKTASQGGDQARADAIMRDFERYAERLRQEFTAAFEGTLSEVSKGFGGSGPFAQANAAISALGETLKAFVRDAEALPQPQINAPRARAGAQQAALAALTPPKSLSDVQQRLAAIQGTASGLSRVLQDLGMSADEAAAAIRGRMSVAMKALRAEFSADLNSKINTAKGQDYKNEVGDLVKERNGLLADARAIGVGTGKVGEYFRLSAQKIIDSSQLTGDAFNALVRSFPELRGQVHAFSEAVDTAAAKAAAAARKLGYDDRAFAAGIDTSTQAGALAAFDRSALRQRAEEAKAGGRAMAALENALSRERTAIIRQFAEAAKQAERQAAEAAIARASGYRERLWAARGDADTRAGALAIFDLKANQERAAEAEAGGRAMAQHEKTLAAERLKIIADFAERAAETERQAREAAAARGEGYLERLWTARGDRQTQSGALAIFDRQAEQQRAAEVAAGGQRIAGLEKTLAAERASIIRDFAEQAAAAEQAIADRRRSYQDELFAAANDNSTRSGALAAFDRQAGQRRADEAKAGGQAMADLERTLAAQRTAIIRDFAEKAKEAEQAAAEALASRRLSYQDRAFAATTDTSTRTGALAAFDRRAAQERAAEAAAGGKGMKELEYTLALERLAILRDFAEQAKAVEQERARAADEVMARKMGFWDRAFAAAVDTSTLAGALAAFDRAADQERAAEVKAGGEARAGLELALSRERAAIIQRFADQAAEIEKQAAARRLSAEDRLFAARTDTATLTGQLAAYDRRAAQERLEETEAGGQAMAKLLAAQEAERLKIIRDAGTEAKEFLLGTFKTIRAYLDDLKTGADTALSPGERLKAARVEFDRQIALARGGDRDALGSITQTASTLLDAGKAMYASGKGYQDILASVTRLLDGLTKQVTSDQVIARANGGWVNGPGTGTSDSIRAMLSDGEFVVNAASARANAGLLEAVNDNRFAMPSLAMPVPVPLAMGGGIDAAAIVAAIRSLEARMERSDDRRKAEAEMVARNVKAGADKVAGAVDEATDEVAGSREDARRDAAPMRAGRGASVKAA